MHLADVLNRFVGGARRSRNDGANAIGTVAAEPSEGSRRRSEGETMGIAQLDQRSQRELEVARTQALFREVNEQLERLAAKFGIDTNLDFVCECGSHKCAENVELTLSEYESVRRIPTRFVVKPGHVLADFERAVEQQRAYTVVEKFGHGGVAAVRFDPRRRRRLTAVTADGA
jgi:hypothetical protein